MNSAGSVALTPAPGQALALSIDDTSKAIGCARGTTYKLIREGKLRAVKLGARTVIPRREIERLLGLDTPNA